MIGNLISTLSAGEPDWPCRGIARFGMRLGALLLAIAYMAPAQTPNSTTEGWPEFDVFIKLNERSRLYIMYAATRQEELNAYADGQTGVYFDYWTLPALRRDLRKNPDASRAKLLLLRSGYLFSRPRNNSGVATDHMWTSEATGRAHLPWHLLLSDRNRLDLRWVNGDFRWRYRNRLKIERTFPSGRFELTPYAHAEIFRDGEQESWTRFRYAAGAEFAVTRRIVLEMYYLRQDDWRSTPQFTNVLGSSLQVYLR